MTRLLHRWATEQAELRPDAPALVMAGTRTTYGELEQRSNQLAHQLRAVGCGPGDRVVLLLPKSPVAVVSLLGVLKAGGVYVPVDPANPPARVAMILASCEPRVVLVTRRTAATLAALATSDASSLVGCRVGYMESPGEDPPVPGDFRLADVAQFSATPLHAGRTLDDAAHILFTSGTTGVPKGVVITHASVAQFVTWANGYFGPRPGDRHSGHSPLHFDLSTYDIFGTFAAGAELHLVPPEANLLPHQLADLIRQAGLTQWFSVPSVLSYMAKAGVVREGDFPTLRRVLWCGEVFPTPALRHWMQRVPHASFTNLYGPTEATIASSYYTVPDLPPDDATAVPIGQACDGEELLVLDDELRPVPNGEVGTLYIGGVGLSPGYWRDPARTGAAFVLHPGSPGGAGGAGGSVAPRRLYRTGDLAHVGADGLVYFRGRDDTQVKSRGYRIELGEIEAALLALDGLEEGAVVAAQSDGFEGTVICCAYVPAPGSGVTAGELRQRLAARLPPYMLPTRWRAFERLPRNANGKIGRRELEEAFARHEAVAH